MASTLICPTFLVTCLPVITLFFLLKENLFLNHSRRNRTTFIGCWTALCHPWSVGPPKNLSLSSRLNFTWRPLSMRFTGSGTTSILRRTSTIFQVQVFVCYSMFFFLLKSCKRVLLLVIILCSRKGESCLISIRLCAETPSHWYDYTTYVNSPRKFQWL